MTINNEWQKETGKLDLEVVFQKVFVLMNIIHVAPHTFSCFENFLTQSTL